MKESGYIRVNYDFLPDQKANYYEPISNQTLYLSKLQLTRAFEQINEKFYADFYILFNEVLALLGGRPQDILNLGWSFENEAQNYSWSYFHPAWIRPQFYVEKETGKLQILFEVDPEPIEDLEFYH